MKKVTQNNQTNISILDAIAGAGKTTITVATAIELAAGGEKVVIIQETQTLLDQTEQDLKEKRSELKEWGVAIHKFHSKSKTCKSVSGSVINHMTEGDSDNNIVLITKETFLEVRANNLDFNQWHCFFDEFMQPFDVIKLKTEWKSEIAFDSLYVALTSNKEYNEIIPSDELFRVIASSPDDYAYQAMRDDGIIRSLGAPYTKTWLSKDKKHLAVLITPDVFDCFKETTILGAKYHQHELSMFWREYSIQESPLTNKLRKLQPKFYMNIGYFNQFKWSKTFKKEENNMQAIAGGLNEFFDNSTTYILTESDELESDLVGLRKFRYCRKSKTEQQGADFIGCKVAGLNTYRDDTAAAFLNTLSLPDFWYKAAKEIFSFGLSDMHKLELTCHNAYFAYQFIYRTACRNPDFEGAINAVVGSKDIAEQLLAMLPSSASVVVSQIEHDLVVDDKPSYFALRTAWNEDKKAKAKELKELKKELTALIKPLQAANRDRKRSNKEPMYCPDLLIEISEFKKTASIQAIRALIDCTRKNESPRKKTGHPLLRVFKEMSGGQHNNEWDSNSSVSSGGQEIHSMSEQDLIEHNTTRLIELLKADGKTDAEIQKILTGSVDHVAIEEDE